MTTENIDKNEDKKLAKIPPKEFFEMLDQCIDLQIKSRQIFDTACDYLRERDFSEWEIVTIVKDYLKDKIPPSTLRRYLKSDKETDKSSVESLSASEITHNNSLETEDYPDDSNIGESELDQQIEAADQTEIIVFNFENIEINLIQQFIEFKIEETGNKAKTLKKLYFTIDKNVIQ